MKRILISFALLATLMSSYAYAATYTYTGDAYTEAAGVYTTDMRVTGTLVTSDPIPPDFSGDISGMLTSWSFNDGVQTITSADGEFSPNVLPLVLTDEHGVIINSILVFLSSPIATTIGATDEFIGVFVGASLGSTDIACSSVENGYCYSWPLLDTDYGVAESYGVWETFIPPPTSIPTMSQWSLMLLALLLGMVGIARIRRKGTAKLKLHS